MNKKIRATRNNIWRIRKKRELKQKEISLLLGHRSSSMVNRWEKGYALPDLKSAFKLAIALSIPVEFLFQEFYKNLKGQILSNKNKINQILSEK